MGSGAWLRAALAAVVLISAGTVAAGDFGRPDPASLARAAPRIGGLNQADAEREMRDRMTRFLHQPHTLQPYPARHRARDIDRTRRAYFSWLTTTAYASSRIRYETISDDVQADLGTLPDAFASICAVIELDRQRAIALERVHIVEPKMPDRVRLRQVHNQQIVAHFAASLRLRFEAYSYAIDHLLVETPHVEAVGVDRRLTALHGFVVDAEEGRFCGGLPGVASGDGEEHEIPSRLASHPPDPVVGDPPK